VLELTSMVDQPPRIAEHRRQIMAGAREHARRLLHDAALREGEDDGAGHGVHSLRQNPAALTASRV
jgi:hypothetical protein